MRQQFTLYERDIETGLDYAKARYFSSGQGRHPLKGASVILDNKDLYETIQFLSNQLSDAGEKEWSCALNDALSISSVPGEILGETRVQLQNLQSSQIPLRLGLNWRVDEALAYLDEVLGPYEV